MSAMSILSILISLAMMMTGTSGAELAEPVSRTLTISNLVVSVNGEEVALDPALRVGASTDGEAALFDVALDVNGESLFPVQVKGDADAIVAMFKNGGAAIGVDTAAVDALIQQRMDSIAPVQMDDESQAIVKFLTEEFVPAYRDLLQAVQDPAFLDEVQKDAQGIVDEIVDRGEGTPVTVPVNGQEMALIAYSYTIDTAQIAELCDRVYQINDTLKAFYDAIFKLYDLMPEESGLKGLTSFQDVFASTGMEMILAVDEQMSEDGEVDIADVTMTMDMSNMVEKLEAAQSDEETAEETVEEAAEETAEEAAEETVEETAEEAVVAEPIVAYIHAVRVGDEATSTMSMDFAAGEGASMNMQLAAEQNATARSMNMTMSVQENEQSVEMFINASSEQDPDTGAKGFGLDFTVSASDEGEFSAGVTGNRNADGTGHADVSFAFSGVDQFVTVAFEMDVDGGEIADEVAGTDAYILKDLSEEGMSKLGEDQALMGAVMQISGSLSQDVGKLMQDESVAQLVQMFTAVRTEEEPEDDYEYDEGDEPEDDGVLPYEMPEFTFLPEGMSVKETNVDTVYDSVDMTISDENGTSNIYAYFYAQGDYSDVPYVLSEDGTIAPMNDQLVNISSLYEGDYSVSMAANGVNTNLYMYGEAFDLDTIGQILAGLKY